MEKMIRWNATKNEIKTITEIYDRARKELEIITSKPKADFIMDIEATHCNGCSLDLDKLLNFPEFDFYHDIYGIIRHLDRQTGKLMDCFLPRCAT